jgi:UDP-GlcNAc:undecaprenyl-phosphate/decaprenyl-phosphate GlcNAc-1-phosphate transferase
VSEVLLAFCMTVAAILALRGWACRIGLVDRPSGRKTHQGEIPLVGGLAIAVGFLAFLLLSAPATVQLAPLIAAVLVVVAVGVVDDLRALSAKAKFLGQVVAALIMTGWAGVAVTDLGNLWGTGDVALNGAALLFAVFCVVGVMNAMNMIDGMDGLAGGIAAVALFWLCLSAHAAGLERGAELACVLLAGVGGFLLFNLRLPGRGRAAVFLGDVGSLLLGFLLAWLAVDLTENGRGEFYPISTVWILGVPIMDTVYIMLRRIARRDSPFRSDRRHIHHTLTYMGFKEAQTLGILVASSGVFGAIGYFGWYFRVPEYVLCYGFLCAFGSYCVFMQNWKVLFRVLGVRKLQREAAKTKEGAM